MTVPLHNALIIPQKATYEIQDKIYVFVVDKNNVVQVKKHYHQLPKCPTCMW